MKLTYKRISYYQTEVDEGLLRRHLKGRSAGEVISNLETYNPCEEDHLYEDDVRLIEEDRERLEELGKEVYDPTKGRVSGGNTGGHSVQTGS